jgi:uncharacterized OsmC-like protein
MRETDGHNRTADAELAVLLEGYRTKCAEDPAAARETVGVIVRRVAGFQSRAEARSKHALLIDEPAEFGGKGEAADPAEVLLAAIGASLCVALTAHAALRGLAIEAVTVTLDAAMDARGFLTPAGGAPSGLIETNLHLTLRSAAPEVELRALVETALAASPVLAALKREPAVILTLEASERLAG